MKTEYIEKIYAGWLAKIIGIRMGAGIEGWSSQKISDVYGELDGYPVDYRLFAADDDSNGPLFFLRALEDCGKGGKMEADDVGEALLNYASFEHGFFWWGGYGCSTEHTAYLNLASGIPAPRSGSIELNGKGVAEQIGGQIFIDTWGLAAPGRPELAARLAREAASVTHDGNGVYGGMFIAACISQAFEETDIRKILEKGLSMIPADSDYSQMVREVIAFYEEHPDNWRDCLEYIQANHGYDRYPGVCHIIPNIAVMILALLYGEGDFSRTLNICNMCGWDTDCNVGNVATIMGVRGGLAAIEERWRKPINDFLACSGVLGSLNIQDIPYGALYIAKQAWKLAGEELPQPYRELAEKRIHSCHFEFPGSTHAMQTRLSQKKVCEAVLQNTDESAHTGSRSLKVTGKHVEPGESFYIYQKTYYVPSDFHDNRYDPAFSPLIYPGQRLHGSILLPEQGETCEAALYVRNARTGEILRGEWTALVPGKWEELEFRIPCLEEALLEEAGYVLISGLGGSEENELTVLIDDLYWDGEPEYTLNFRTETEEVWTPLHKEISQFTRYKGNFYLEDGRANLSCTDIGAAFTGRYDWTDYTAEFFLEPVSGEEHYGAVRVQGAMRSYLAGFQKGKFVILKKSRQGIDVLAETDYSWKYGESYLIRVCVKGKEILAQVGDTVLQVKDENSPYLQGCVGLAVAHGSHARYQGLRISKDELHKQ